MRFIRVRRLEDSGATKKRNADGMLNTKMQLYANLASFDRTARDRL